MYCREQDLSEFSGGYRIPKHDRPLPRELQLGTTSSGVSRFISPATRLYSASEAGSCCGACASNGGNCSSSAPSTTCGGGSGGGCDGHDRYQYVPPSKKRAIHGGNTAREEAAEIAALDHVIFAVDSKNRDTSRYPSPTSFTVPFRYAGSSYLRKIEIRDISIPSALYNVTHLNNTLYISESAYTATDPIVNVTGPVYYKLTVPPGCYTYDTLLEVLNASAQSWSAVVVNDLNISTSLNDSTSTHTHRCFNEYKWGVDVRQMKFMLKATQLNKDIPSPIAPIGVQVHCPPTNLTRPGKWSGGAGAPVKPELTTDVIVTDVTRNSTPVATDTYNVTFSTPYCDHNIIPNALILQMTFRSVPSSTSQSTPAPVKTWTVKNVMAPASMTYTNKSVTLPVYINPSANPWPFTSSDTIVGWIRPCASVNSLWGLIGFNNSVAAGYTDIPVSNVGMSDEYTWIVLKYPTMATGVTPAGEIQKLGLSVESVVLPSGVGWNVTGGTPKTLAGDVIRYDSDYVLRVPIANLSMSGPTIGSAYDNDKLIVRHYNTFISDTSFDLRYRSTNVLMTLKINGHQIGSQNVLTHSSSAFNIEDLGPVFANILIDAPAGSNSVNYDRQCDMGMYRFVSDMGDHGEMEISLHDMDGNPYASISTLNWHCTFRMTFEHIVTPPLSKQLLYESSASPTTACYMSPPSP